jgi:UDP-N-acetylglucosamine--N-acetylmuramyl-(pentapeptide) pyrophosphoryl-undecaprenol N-acetylglucosamine transferase
VYASFAASERWFPAGRVVVAGNPVRRELIESTRDVRRGAGPPRLLVFGGSQGARSINDNAPRIAAEIVASGLDIEVRHASGPGAEERVASAYAAAGVNARVDGYIDDMATAYRDADMALCRAGATTIAELTAIGLPALYVPFPHAADDHQTANAQAIVESGGGVMVRDDEMSGDRPVRLLGSLLGMPEVLDRMRAAARGLGRPDAAVEIAEDLLSRLEM